MKDKGRRYKYSRPKKTKEGFPGGSAVKNPPAKAGDMGSSPGWEDSTCHMATKPWCHSYQACAPEPGSRNH